MSLELLVIVVWSVATLSVLSSAANTTCPVWFYYNTKVSSCICSPSKEGYITCSQDENMTSRLHLGMTLGALNKDHSMAFVADIPYIFPKDQVDSTRLQIILTSSLHEERNKLCSSLHRSATWANNQKICGRCNMSHGYGPAVYSYGLQCVKCNVWLGLVKYTVLQIIPITIFYFAVLIFRINLIRPNMFHYVVFCTIITFIFRYSAELCMSYLYTTGVLPSFMMKLGLTLSGVWCLDFFRFVVPPFCFNINLHDCMVPFFDFFPAVYLIFLTLIIAGLVKLHSYRLRPIVRVWSPFQKLLVLCKLNYDPVEAIVHTYANFFFLYFAKTVSTICLTLKTASALPQNGTKTIYRTTLYYAPTSTYFETRHIIIMMVVIVVASVLILPALILLVVFRTSQFQQFYQAKVSRGWQKILRIFVKSFENGYQDGSNGTRDYRAMGGGYLMLIIFWCSILILLTRNVKFSNNLQWPVLCLGFTLIAVMYGSLRPYKKRSSNNMAVLVYATLIVIGNIICFLELQSPNIYYRERRIMLIFIMAIVLVVNSIYTVYITHNIVIYFVTRERATKWANFFRRQLYKCPCKRIQNEDQEQLLHNPGLPAHHYH